jgi:glycosyltransferase involved in cell wall biosynthesis
LSRHILFVSHSVEWVGPTQSLLLLAAGLQAEFEISVLVPGRGQFSEELDRNGIRYLSLPSLSKWAVPSITRMIRRESVDLVYGNNTRSPSRVGFVAASLAGRPFVCHVRSMEWQTSWARLGYLRLAKAVIAVSRACAGSVARFVSPDRVHVVYNGVRLGDYAADDERGRNSLRAELGLTDNTLLLASVSHLSQRKGQEHSIGAMAQILQALPDAHLCLIGRTDRDPAYVDRLRESARDANLSSHVHFLGFRDDVSRVLQEADVFVHTAAADPHPRAVVEAMAARLPVVAFAVDGVEETVVDGVTGHLVEAGNRSALAAAVLDLLTSPETRSRMGTAGRDRAERCFSADATTRQVRHIITDVIGGSSR